MVNDRLKNIQSWFFAANCALCGAAVGAGRQLCSPCEAALPRLGSACQKCAAHLTDAGAAAICGVCQQQPPAYDAVCAAFAYGPPLDRLIQGLKYRRQLHLARALARYLAEAVGATTTVDVMVPVPLHRSRLRERGYNQSLELARTMARTLQLPVVYRGIARTRRTPPQTGLARADRRKNVRGAFHIGRDDLRGKRVAIVDDVMTSGATLDALATALRVAGVAHIQGWVVARA